MAKDTQLSRRVLNQGSLAPEEMSVTHKLNCTNHKNQIVFNCSSCAHWEPAKYLGHSVPSARTPSPMKPCVCLLTRGWRCVQMHVLAVLSIASLVAATDTQHIHRACVRVLKKGTGAPHLLPTLPTCRAWLGGDIRTPKFNSVMPGRW